MNRPAQIRISFSHAGCKYVQTYVSREIAERHVKACDRILTSQHAVPAGVLAVTLEQRRALIEALQG